MATQQENVRINKTDRKCGKRIFFFFFFKGEDVAKELRSRKKLLFLNFSWFEKRVEWSQESLKFCLMSDSHSHLLSQYVTTLTVPHFYYYIYIYIYRERERERERCICCT